MERTSINISYAISPLKIIMASEDNKRIAKNTLFLYIRSILIILVALYTTRITLQVLGETNYGIYNIVGGAVMLFSMLSGSMIAASQRFITFALGKKDKKKVKVVFDTCVSLHIVVALILFPILEILGIWLLYHKLSIPAERLNAAFWVLQCSILTLLGNIITIPFTALITAYEKMAAYAYISVIEVLLKLGGVVSLLFFFKDKLIAYSIILASIVIIVQLIYSTYSYIKFEEGRDIKIGIKGSLFKDMFAFSGWNLLGSGSYLLRNQGIDILLNIYFGVIVNAAKGICSQVQNAVTTFVSNFQMAVNPQLTKSIAQEDYDRNHVLVMQGGRMSFYLMTVFSIPIITNCYGILKVWLKEIPAWTELFIQWTLVYCLWDVLSRFLINTILATGNIRNYELIVGGTKLLALPLTWIILTNGGSPLSGIIVNIILEIFCLGERLWFNYKFTGLSYGKYILRTVIACWSLFLIALGIVEAIKYFLFSNIYVLLPFSFIITIAIIFGIGLTTQEKVMVKRFIIAKLSR